MSLGCVPIINVSHIPCIPHTLEAMGMVFVDVLMFSVDEPSASPCYKSYHRHQGQPVCEWPFVVSIFYKCFKGYQNSKE